MRTLLNHLRQLSLVLVLSFCYPFSVALAGDDVLVLLRGTAAHPFNQELLEGMMGANDRAPKPLNFEIFYTGNRFNRPDNQRWNKYYQGLQNFSGDKSWRAVVVSWPNDLQFALKYYPETTIINFSPQVYSGPADVINLGQEFKQRIAATLKWLKDDYPKRNALHLIVGSRAVDDPAVQQILEVAQTLGFAPPDLLISRNPSELERQVARLSEDAALLYMPLLTDDNGEPLIARDVLSRLAEVSSAPIFSPLESYVYAGAVGGYVGSVDLYGVALVELLQNEVNLDLAQAGLKTSGWVFNQLQLQRYAMSVPPADDPRFEGALIINKPPPLFSERGWAVLATLGASAGVLLMLSLMWSRREAKSRRTIESLNHNLNQKNLELTDTNQELEGALYEAALQELKAATRTAQLQLAMRLASVTVFEVDYQTLRARRSGETEWKPLLQVLAGGLEDSQQIERILTLNQTPYTDLDVECWEAGQSDTAQRHAYRLTLSEKAENEDGQEVFYLVRQEISDVKDAQQRLEAEAQERKAYQLQVARMTEHLKRFQRENSTLTEIAKRADQDPLTGCLNRRGWERLAEQEFSRLKRQRRTSSTLLMLDLDFFKKINDGHGHLAGDKVLKDFVATVKGELRESDLFGRFGGEEFLVLLLDTDAAAASHYAERLRVLASALPTDFDGGLTVSIGVAQHSNQMESLQRWIEVADGALYLAKAKGRNRVQVA